MTPADLVNLAREMRSLGVAEFSCDSASVRFMPYELEKPELTEAGEINTARANKQDEAEGKAKALEFHSA